MSQRSNHDVRVIELIESKRRRKKRNNIRQKTRLAWATIE